MLTRIHLPQDQLKTAFYVHEYDGINTKKNPVQIPNKSPYQGRHAKKNMLINLLFLYYKDNLIPMYYVLLSWL